MAREESRVPWRVYRPAIVVGHSRTGEMDKIDGPYYFFKLLKYSRDRLPAWPPLVPFALRYTNVLPVDFVAAATSHLPHTPGHAGVAFHPVHSKSDGTGTSDRSIN